MAKRRRGTGREGGGREHGSDQDSHELAAGFATTPPLPPSPKNTPMVANVNGGGAEGRRSIQKFSAGCAARCNYASRGGIPTTSNFLAVPVSGS